MTADAQSESDPGTATIARRLEAINGRIDAACRRTGRDPRNVTLLGVTKKKSIDVVRNAITAGITDIGENYVQELVEKAQAVGPGPRWHFIGHLQRNKVRVVAPIVSLIHGVDSERLAVEIDSEGNRLGRPLPILIQVNTSGENSKSGVPSSEAIELAVRIDQLPAIDLQGLMTIPAPADDPEQARPLFRELRLIRDRIEQQTSRSLPHLSMGMTDDFDVAIEEGSTIIRIGTALFGSRED